MNHFRCWQRLAPSAQARERLQRRFKVDCGQAPLSFLQAAQIDRAKAMLEGTDHSIANRAGYGDVSDFRNLFRTLAEIPSEVVRRRFKMTFENDAGRSAHLQGQVAAAHATQGGALLADHDRTGRNSRFQTAAVRQRGRRSKIVKRLRAVI
jgi:AraC-like DNA-binding protein